MDAATAEYPFSEIRLPKLITALLPELIGNVEHRREPKSGTALQVTGVLRFSDIHLGTLAGPTPIPAGMVASCRAKDPGLSCSLRY